MAKLYRFQHQSFRLNLRAYQRPLKPVRRLGGRPVTSPVQSPYQPILEELVAAGLSPDQAVRTLWLALNDSIPDYSRKMIPDRVRMIMRVLGWTWRVPVLVTIAVLALRGFEPHLLFGGLASASLWLAVFAGINLAGTYFYMRSCHLEFGSVWLVAKAGFVRRRRTPINWRGAMKWVGRQPDPWLVAAYLQLGPLLLQCAFGSVAFAGLALWSLVRFVSAL